MKRVLKKISQLFTIFVFAILLNEILLNQINLLIDSRLLIVLLVGLLISLRLIKINIFSEKFAKNSLYFLLLFTIISYVLLYLENKFGFQYVANKFNIDYSRFIYLTLVIAGLTFYSASFRFKKYILKKIIFSIPVLLGLIAFFIFVRNNVLFRLIIQDDNLVEYLQFVLLIVSSYLSFCIAIYWRKKNKILAILFLFTAVACFFVAGEEISWGQRLIGLETPETIAERNLQNELTLHNVDIFFGWVYRGYMIIGLLGSVSWIFLKIFKDKLSKKWLTIFINIIPDWFFFLYFFQAFFYSFYWTYKQSNLIETLWEEPMELLLIIGITLFFAVKYFRVCGSKITKKYKQILVI